MLRTMSMSSLHFCVEIFFIGVELLMDAIKKAGYEKEVKIGMDVAASEFLLPSGMWTSLVHELWNKFCRYECLIKKVPH